VRLLFIILIGVLAGSDIFQLTMSMGPGLSVKNALLYPIALGLLFQQLAQRSDSHIDLSAPRLNHCQCDARRRLSRLQASELHEDAFGMLIHAELCRQKSRLGETLEQHRIHWLAPSCRRAGARR